MKPKMTKNNIIRNLQAKLEEEGIKLTQKEIRTIVNTLFKEIMEYTNTMNEVQIRDFGTFRKVAREYKIGGKEGKTYVIRFSPSKIFKKMINE